MLDRLTRLLEPTPRTAEAWLVRMGRPDASPRDLAALEAWLDADPARLDAYQALKATHRQTAALRSRLTAEIAAVPRAKPRAVRRSRRMWLGAPVLAGLAVAALAITIRPDLFPVGRTDPMTGAVVHTTRVGEIRDIQLADGTVATLDTGSVIRVAVAGARRRVVLDRGQAYFDVRPDANRPFEVDAADRKIVVTGTRFVVARSGNQGAVTLFEGAVSLTKGSGRAIHMTPGDAASYQAGVSRVQLTRTDPGEDAPWRRRQLVFRDTPLSEVVTELSRYTTETITADDPRLQGQRVTAVFPLDGDRSVVDHIDRLLPVVVDRTRAGAVTIRPE